MPSAALARHPDTSCAALRGIAVSVDRADGGVRVSFALDGDIDRLRIPPSRPPRATDRLWQHTCCELFVARDGEPGYREFNFSPSGEWAAYAFDGYRQGQRSIECRPSIEVHRSANLLQLEACVPLPREKLRLGLAAVIEDAQGGLSYWALRHAPGKPDFHHSAAFALDLDAVRH